MRTISFDGVIVGGGGAGMLVGYGLSGGLDLERDDNVEFAGMSALDTWYARVDVDEVLGGAEDDLGGVGLSAIQGGVMAKASRTPRTSGRSCARPSGGCDSISGGQLPMSWCLSRPKAINAAKPWPLGGSSCRS